MTLLGGYLSTCSGQTPCENYHKGSKMYYQRVAGDEHVLRTRVVRTDNDTEFVNSDVKQLFAQAGIIHERTCPHTSHQNGVAERSIGKIMPIVRTMIADASMDPNYWGEAMMSATHVLNRMPTSSNDNNTSPFQVRFRRRPSLTHLQPWGITAYVRRDTAQTKVVNRADVGILVGYGHEVDNKKGWRIYVPRKRKVITSKHVSFDRSLAENVARRVAFHKSTQLPEQIPLTGPTTPLQPLPPASAFLPPPPPLPQVTQPVVPPPATVAAPPPSAVPHPVCTRADTGDIIQPSEVEQQVSSTRPVTRSTSSWSDVLKKADKDIDQDSPNLIPRPRGRPPKNHEWDATRGPVNMCRSTSRLHRASTEPGSSQRFAQI